jgi:CPA1 family monovalent cation:H+ antiporter
MQPDLVHGIVFVCLSLIGLCAVEHHFRFSRLPYISWLVLFGIAYGVLNKTFFPRLPDLELSPDAILYLFLPILIFESSRRLDLGHGRKVVVRSFLLASVGMLVSMFVMAVPLRLFPNMRWRDILLFTAIMSATDPVAVSAIFKQFNVPERLKTLVEGESLLNDGTSVILFTMLCDIIFEGKSLLVARDIAAFAGSVGAAVLLGATAGWGGAWVIRKWKALKDHFIGPLLPLLIIYLVFCAAQAWLDISGVIAVMTTTLVLRSAASSFNKTELPSRLEISFYRSLWEFLADLANAILFFMLGVEMGAHTADITWWVMPLVIGALLLARSVVSYGFGLLAKLAGHPLPVSWLHVLNFSGLKGALSVALILMIPRDYPYRHVFLCAALALCLFTLVANTLVMRVYLSRTTFVDGDGE